MALIDDAREELRRLESHWISLLSWFAEKLKTTPDALISEWDANAFFNATARQAAESKKSPRSKWTLPQFIDTGAYAHLAAKHRARVEPLGNPPRGWPAQLERQNQDGIVTFRNQMAHTSRFSMLAVEDQKRAGAAFKEQRECLAKWWPDHQPKLLPPPPPESAMRAALRLLGPNPDDALPLIEQLGMRPIRSPRNLIDQTGMPSALTSQLSGDLDELFEIGDKELGGARAAIYLARLHAWHPRSAARERVRRRLAKALRERETETLRIIILTDASGQASDVEFVLPRVRADKGVGTVRAAISTQSPTRYHVQLLESLVVDGVATLPMLTRRWIEAFSVETVTTRFYEEFRELRDRLVGELQRCNPHIPELQGDPKKNHDLDVELHAFGTRQLSRILFLWFLQQKRWLGDSPGSGNLNFVSKIFSDHGGSSDTFFSDILVPIFFDGLGRRAGERRKNIVDTYGWMPPLGGSIFSAGANDFEQRVFDFDDEGVPRRRVALPDDLFDPRKDESEAVSGRNAKRMRSVLGLLRGYRFTTQESTPDDQSVDPDPELLGKVFENLYQADERHKTGAYYTPREIVQFMCRRTLDGYLIQQTGRTQDDLNWLRREAEDPTLDDRKLKPDESQELIDALERVRVIDPAVGSGAFLLAMMHEIVTLKRGVEQADDRTVEPASSDVATWKGRVATNSLYGVDINPMAVEICHLRLWLSIIVDLDAHAPRDIPTLPNLDFRIVAGDSLIDRMGAKPCFESLPPPSPDDFDMFLHGKVKAIQRELNGLKDKFRLAEGGDSDHKRLRVLRNKIRAKQIEIAKEQIAHAIDGPDGARPTLAKLERPKASARKPTKKQVDDARARLSNLESLLAGLHDRAAYQKPFLWPVNFHDVFEAGGFDIVVANPPYVRVEDQDPVDKKTYPFAFAGALASGADLLVCFYARALHVLRSGGQLGFITSNKYMRAAYGTSIREFLPARLHLREVIDFGDLPVFDAAAYPAVLIGAKIENAPESWTLRVADLVYPIRRRLADDGLRVNTDNVRLALQDLAGLLEEAAVNDYPQVLLRRAGWILEDPALVRLFESLLTSGVSLFEYAGGRLHYGVKTGRNRAFVITESQRAALIKEDPKSSEVIKKWILGRHIRRWRAEWRGLYGIFTRRGTNIERYPAIKRHLAHWKGDLTPKQRGDPSSKPGRKPGDYQWFEIQDNVAYFAEFEKPKIVWPLTVPPWETRFAYDASGAFINNKGYFLPMDDPKLCAYLNSPLCLWMLDKMTTRLRGGYLELKSDDVVGRLPIPATLPDAGMADGRQLHDAVVQALGLPQDAAEEIWKWHERRQIYRKDPDLTESDSDLGDDDDA